MLADSLVASMAELMVVGKAGKTVEKWVAEWDTQKAVGLVGWRAGKLVAMWVVQWVGKLVE